MPRNARSAVVGVSDHAGWAVLVTVAGGKLVDRRRVELVEPGLPVMPYHHPAADAVATVERVTASAARCAAKALAELEDVRAIALRVCPKLPGSIAERLASVHARNNADWVMYRQALADAAVARGWKVCWYDAKQVLADAPAEMLRQTGAALGPPWTKDHRQAMAAALAA